MADVAKQNEVSETNFEQRRRKQTKFTCGKERSKMIEGRLSISDRSVVLSNKKKLDTLGVFILLDWVLTLLR